MHRFDITMAGVLFVVFLVELLLIAIHHRDRKVLKDMGANLVIGVWLILAGLVVKGIQVLLYSYLHEIRMFDLFGSWWWWVAAFFCCDFIHYAYHWLGHKTRLFWAAHVTHHSSEYLNLSIGWRTNFIHVFYRFLFWAPLCIIGFPPEMILLIESITAIQNFLVHTEKVGKLRVFDIVFNTPSNHRVHHATNPEYIDKNLGGVLMIYDHIFGTYAKEVAKPVYGITHNIETQNPVMIVFHEFIHVFTDIKKIPGILAKLRYLFSVPI